MEDIAGVVTLGMPCKKNINFVMIITGPYFEMQFLSQLY